MAESYNRGMSSNSPAGRVIVVGGGLAGLAAAVGVAGQGTPVTLLESRNRLGGRASSFDDRESGDTVDNCQHVSMGCCTNLQHFCRTVGVADQFEVAREMTFLDPEGRSSRFGPAPLPAPFHLAPAFLRLKYLTLREKLGIARALRALARERPGVRGGSDSFQNWLTRHGQSPRAVERFWNVVLVSALSESLDRVDVGYARKVFVDGFLSHPRGGDVYVPRVSLDQIFGPPVQRWLEAHGGEVRLNARVAQVSGGLDGVTSLDLRGGESLAAEDYILAVPQHQFLDLLPADVASHAALAGVASIETAPISSIHLWFDRPITPLPHAVLVGRLCQWMFQQPRVADALRETPWRYQIVISASREVVSLPREEVRDRVLHDLGELWPETRAARLLHWRLVTEHRAVFSATPGIDRLRPTQQSPVPNLQLAGDWTATGWPATMEGAVRSGFLAAENVLARRGRAQRLLQPDLPVGFLPRWLLGLRRDVGSEG
jgi:squalene-associated FAD-dependent desaturase